MGQTINRLRKHKHDKVQKPKGINSLQHDLQQYGLTPRW